MRQSAVRPFKRGVLFERFFKKSALVQPVALFQKMPFWVDLAKIAITWLFAQFWSRLFAPKSSPVFAL